MIIFSDYNEPYLFAISFVLLIGILEIVSLIFGHMLSGAIDAHLITSIPLILVLLDKYYIF